MEKKVDVEVIRGTMDLKVGTFDYDRVVEALARMGYEVEVLDGPREGYSIIHVVVDEDHGDPSEFLDVYYNDEVD